MARKDFPSKADPVRPCQACGKPMMFVHNIATGKSGPVDVRAVVYVIRGDLRNVLGTAAQTAKEFLSEIESITLKNGQTIKPDGLAIYVSHFATCPHPERFSNK